jgi:hypothetical protein
VILAGIVAVTIGLASIVRPAAAKHVVATCPLTNTIDASPLARVRFGICLPTQ